VKRRKSDPRVREVLAAFDRQAQSVARDKSSLCLWMTMVADTGVDRFQIPGGWNDDAIRAVLLAFLLNAPDADLDDMLEKARKEDSELPAFEAEWLAERAA
jgi:hypothetical protein